MPVIPMKKNLSAIPVLGVLLMLSPCPVAAQPQGEVWTDQQLEEAIKGFLTPTTRAQLEQVASLLKHEDEAFIAICNKIHGNHSEYLLRIEKLMDQLTDERWEEREKAERTLIEIGARAILPE